jgi:hypothetical protein
VVAGERQTFWCMTGAIVLVMLTPQCSASPNHGHGATVNSAVLGITKNRAIPCLNCGYDITGLARESVCPECALPLKDTLEASALLRGYPKSLIRRIDWGVCLMAWSPLALVCGLPIAAILMAPLFLVRTADTWIGVAIGLGLGCLGAVCSFGAGAVLLSRSIPGRPLRPAWAPIVLRYLGPLGVAVAGATPLIRWTSFALSSTANLIAGGVFQTTCLLTLAAAFNVCRDIDRWTQFGQERNRPPWRTWAPIIALATVWLLGYWIFPGVSGRLTLAHDGEWGQGWLLAVLIIEGDWLWRVVAAVDLERRASAYGRRQPPAPTIAA